MVLGQAEDLLGDGVEQHFVGAARDAARGRVDPARRPILFLRGMVVEGEAIAPLKIDRELGELLRSEEHTSELQSLMRISYAVFCLKKKKQHTYSQVSYYSLTQ